MFVSSIVPKYSLLMVSNYPKMFVSSMVTILIVDLKFKSSIIMFYKKISTIHFEISYLLGK